MHVLLFHLRVFPWILVFHLIGVVLWVGGLLTVMPVLAAHTQEHSPEARQALSRIETMFLRRLAHPGAAVVVITGIAMIFTNLPYYGHAHWLHLKLLWVVVLILLDLRVTFRARAFQAGRIEMGRKECRTLAAVIGAAFVIILILVLVKPL